MAWNTLIGEPKDWMCCTIYPEWFEQLCHWGIESSTNQWERTSNYDSCTRTFILIILYQWIYIYIYIHIYMCFSNVFTCFYWHMLVIHGYSMIPPGEAKQLSSSPSRRCAATPCDIFGASLHTADSEKSCDLHDISSGWWYTYPSEKYESQLGWLFPIYGKIKNAPNHQPVIVTIVVYSHNSSHYIVL